LNNEFLQKRLSHWESGQACQPSRHLWGIKIHMAFKFCPICGELLSLADNFLASQKCSACGVTHYHNSKPCVGALIVKDGKVLLTKRGVEPFRGYWDLPGGYLEAGEHPVDGMVREMQEELGIKVHSKELLGIYLDRYGSEQDAAHTMNLYYVAELVAGDPRAADDVSEFGWFGMDELPEQMAFNHEKKVLMDLKKRIGIG
jgi:8-oxo-dGTP diphosphatase